MLEEEDDDEDDDDHDENARVWHKLLPPVCWPLISDQSGSWNKWASIHWASNITWRLAIIGAAHPHAQESSGCPYPSSPFLSFHVLSPMMCLGPGHQPHSVPTPASNLQKSSHQVLKIRKGMESIESSSRFGRKSTTVFKPCGTGSTSLARLGETGSVFKNSSLVKIQAQVVNLNDLTIRWQSLGRHCLHVGWRACWKKKNWLTIWKMCTHHWIVLECFTSTRRGKSIHMLVFTLPYPRWVHVSLLSSWTFGSVDASKLDTLTSHHLIDLSFPLGKNWYPLLENHHAVKSLSPKGGDSTVTWNLSLQSTRTMWSSIEPIHTSLPL